jgi:hypothetical protein
VHCILSKECKVGDGAILCIVSCQRKCKLGDGGSFQCDIGMEIFVFLFFRALECNTPLSKKFVNIVYITSRKSRHILLVLFSGILSLMWVCVRVCYFA